MNNKDASCKMLMSGMMHIIGVGLEYLFLDYRLCKVEKVSSILNLLSKTKEGKKQNMIMLNSKVPIN